MRRLFSLLLVLICCRDMSLAAERPNILWLSCEDISPHLGCYGVKEATTPNLDRFAAQGVRYRNAASVAGVCAPSRSAIITGVYPTTLGTQNMRSVARLPEFIQPFPKLLRNSGYYCTNNVKQDYQFVCPPGVWDASSANAHWRKRKDKSQPFFAVFNYTGTHESAIFQEKTYKKLTEGIAPHDRNKLAKTLPPYYPDTPLVREDWGRYFDLVTAMDRWFGEKLAELEASGEAENTIVFFWSDHGVGLPRAKRWLYQSGTHVPLIVRIPKKFRVAGQGEPGSESERLVSLLDLGPTALNLCGVKVPEWMQGKPFLGKNLPAEPDYLFGVRDRMDERYDLIRSVRDKKFHYLRNDIPWKPYDQYLDYATQEATLRELRRVAAGGKLPPEAKAFMAAKKPREELYDLASDPHELKNLAGSPEHQDVLTRLREVARDWSNKTRDLGLMNESEMMRREKLVGSRYEILRQLGSEELMRRLRGAADLVGDPSSSVSDLVRVATDPDPAVRWWGMTGLGLVQSSQPVGLETLRKGLKDESACVRVAAAGALHRKGGTKEALPVLIQALNEGESVDRLQAAIVLDEMDQDARTALNDLKKALKEKDDPQFDGKYVVRVAEQALRGLTE
ncbi:MAG: sulfatase-like hydrolase/transferase [Planctomycetales bacterium]